MAKAVKKAAHKVLGDRLVIGEEWRAPVYDLFRAWATPDRDEFLYFD